ncbi:threonine/serine dehydratase [Bradyrhizobium sp. LHD-71]|uniref:threonine/serine dehydratase n=1 Tax=Bradyrhizobium sp. LHD-71 TaxID=3072141 RepID=UPI00280DFF75|nr:threonine/serine dehydratase [Bradyrhizobium sp. LHD-71]MDQ8727837.1 threonine/serine dehydratase [Bradyrhizobium sp. LHD-71]
MLAETGITREAIARTETLIRPFVRRTPTVAVDGADFDMAAGPLQLKLECLQHTGTFKVRGAFANLMTRAVPQAGVVAASGGNHGVAVAYAAKKRDVRATIFVPKVSSPAKIELIRRYGADLVVTGERYADALAASEDFTKETGALPIHAFDQAETLLGQGTVGCEIEADTSKIDTLLVAVGGGGLIGGIAAWFESRIKVVAVEPEGAPTLYQALQAGEPVDAPAEGIAADSLAPKRVGQVMFPIAQHHVHRAVLVADDAIRAAQTALWNAVRIVAEPGGAAAFAALLSGSYVPSPGERLAVLVCGANTAAVTFD